ncbi:MAG: hypothetical protein MUP02_06005, partial [Actinobacteria bacterium]|nr:hypothetical protein [Actinomycetota bacterium]
ILSYLKPAQYGSGSIVGITENFIYYDDYIYRYYPVEAEELWIFPTWKLIDIENQHLDKISEEIRSNKFLEKLKEKTGITISTQELKNSIEINVDRDIRLLNLYTYAEDADTAYNINQAILSILLESKSSEREMTLENLIIKMVEFQANNLAILNDLNIRLESEDYLAQIEIDKYHEVYSNFEEIKGLLIKNKSFFINRLEILKEPEITDVDRYTSFPRDVIISFFSAIAIALIMVFIVNYFQASRKPSRQIPKA